MITSGCQPTLPWPLLLLLPLHVPDLAQARPV
jgi:hypothetical protein